MGRPHTGYGDCGARELVATGPAQIRFDLSIAKRVQIVSRVRAQFKVEMLNAFNRPWFVPVGLADNNTVYTTVDSFKVTTLSGETTSRVMQFVFRVDW